MALLRFSNPACHISLAGHVNKGGVVGAVLTVRGKAQEGGTATYRAVVDEAGTGSAAHCRRSG